MIYLKAVNTEDAEAEYEYYTSLPEDENGFTNSYFGVSHEEFMTHVLPKLMKRARGEGLAEGRVPGTEFLLWEDDHIVGLFRVRHNLNEVLREGAGHIGFGIKPEYRGRGYASRGLALAIEEAKKIIPEDEIYMSVDKDNPASLKAMLRNGAYIHHEDDEEYYTRIKIQ